MTDVPDQRGMSGEKTGLADYIIGGGEFPLAYLLRRRRWPQLEHLVQAGWTYTIDSAICEELHENTAQGHFLQDCFDLTKAKPKDMLRMTKEEAAAMAAKRWERRRAAAWMRCEGLTAAEFEALCARYGDYDTARAAQLYGAAMLRRIDAYLQKQKQRYRLDGAALSIYIDYRNMLAAVGGGETEIELFPPRLRNVHDRISAANRYAKSHVADKLFEAMREKWAALEWSDGELCVLLPRCQSDLIFEGATLRHCVGGYAEAHCSGKLILFIRHARRPERSWFTLNIDVTGKDWRRVQLHGYGNEWAGNRKLRIPDRVLDFVKRWEREVLTPAFRQVKAAEAKADKSKTKTKKESAA